MNIKIINDYQTDENCYVISENGKCVVVDPGLAYSDLKDYIENNNLKIEKILLTHCHYDHICSVDKLKEYSKAKVMASEECRENIKSPVVNVANIFGKDFAGDFVDEVISDGEEINIDGIKLKCIKTPGHTNGCVCYLADDFIITGDTLFSGTVGRWDFPTGDFKTLSKSIMEKLYILNPDIIVYPGHGQSTTIGKESLYNNCVTME